MPTDPPAKPDFKTAAEPEKTPTKTTETTEISKERLGQYEAVYRGYWEDDAPPGYIEQAASQMNIHEFAAYERAKPAFRFSPMYQELRGE